MVTGSGLEELAKEPNGVLLHSELAADAKLGVGDTASLTIFPDDPERAAEVQLRVVGIFSSVPPTSAGAEIVTTVAALPRASTVPPDFYLARVAPGRLPADVAASLRDGPLAQKFAVTAVSAPEERGLTALNLAGLSLIESVGAALMAAIGCATLGAFLVLERRREFAILHAVGADARQILTGPLLEGVLVVLGSLGIGVPVGLGLGVLAVRILGLFFTLEPPLLAAPAGQLLALALFMVLASSVALGTTLAGVSRVRAASLLRET
jgi:putative ABC transport system permease protein